MKGDEDEKLASSFVEQNHTKVSRGKDKQSITKAYVTFKSMTAFTTM